MKPWHVGRIEEIACGNWFKAQTVLEESDVREGNL